MHTKDKIDQFIESAIDLVIAENPPELSVGDVRAALLSENPLLLNSKPENLDRRIDIALAKRFDPMRRAEMLIEDFLQGRAETELHGKEALAYLALVQELGEELQEHAESLLAESSYRQ